MQAPAIAASAALLCLTFLAGCSSTPPATGCPQVTAGQLHAFTIHVGSNRDGSMYMTPNEVRVHVGDKVQFNVVNDDSIFHDLAVEYCGHSYEHETPALQRAQTAVGCDNGASQDCVHYFVATLAGNFMMKCEVLQPNHADLGMKGTFIVEA